VTIVLLNVALMYAMARVTLRRTFFRFDFAKPFLQSLPMTSNLILPDAASA
jgi:hypothetical protein